MLGWFATIYKQCTAIINIEELFPALSQFQHPTK